MYDGYIIFIFVLSVFLAEDEEDTETMAAFLFIKSDSRKAAAIQLTLPGKQNTMKKVFYTREIDTN